MLLTCYFFCNSVVSEGVSVVPNGIIMCMTILPADSSGSKHTTSIWKPILWTCYSPLQKNTVKIPVASCRTDVVLPHNSVVPNGPLSINT